MWLLLVLLGTVHANNYPLFDISTLMRLLLVPADTDVNTAIYRLRGRDAEHDYPLTFDITGTNVVRVENLPCRVNHSYCEANVILTRALEAGRLYDMKASVKDRQGHTTTISCTLKGSNGTTRDSDIFPHRPNLITVREDAKRGAALGYVLARKNPGNARHASLELRGSPEFALEQHLAAADMVNGTIYLKGQLDFELKSMYTLTVYAIDPYVEAGNDTRNLAGFQLAVAVLDVQDTAPVFMSAPPITTLNSTLQPGDIVLRVRAEDGDRGSPRDIRYGFAPEGNPFTAFFDIDEKTGSVKLSRPLKELSAITGINQPILLEIVAQEVKTGIGDPAGMTTSVKVAMLLGELGNTPPYFESPSYVARVAENSPQGTALQFEDPYVTEVRDDNMGKNGVFSLTLENNNGTFEISPSVGERRTNFVILVRNNQLLDYETRDQLRFTIVAHEVSPGVSLSSSANVTVYIDDVNDNPPVFVEPQYIAELAENVTAGTRLLQVHAEDIDTGLSGRVQYTGIIGHLNSSLTLDPHTGVITVATNSHKFDREAASEFRFTVEARDMEGVGNRATVPLIVHLIDVNDETPRFERSLYEFILTPDLRNFTVRAFLKAVDLDAEPPNNEVRYEIMNGNYDNKFYLNEVTGELTLLEPLTPTRRRRLKRESGVESVIGLSVRAYDLGVPHRWSHASVRVYPPETRARTMKFIVNGVRPDIQSTEDMLASITGGRVNIKEVLPYLPPADNHLSTREEDHEKSVVVATILYDGSSLVDVSQLQEKLQKNQTIAPVMEYRAENRVLFWILMILAFLIVLIIILLLLCCICPCCPLYVDPKTHAQRGEPQTRHEENVHLVINEQGPGMETKSVQAGVQNGRREAWSADIKEQQWRFNRRNARPLELTTETRAHAQDYHQQYNEDRRSISSLPPHQTHQNLRLRDGPALVFARDRDRDRDRAVENRNIAFAREPRIQNRDVYLEDLDAEFPTIRLLQPRDMRQATRQTSEEEEEDSMRRHEVERGSDVGYRRPGGQDDEGGVDLSTAAAARRDQFYIRDGNAEILRLLTRGRQEEYTLNQDARPMTLVPRQGKEIIMRRFMEDQRRNTGEASGSHQATQDSPGPVLTSTEQLQQLLLRRLLEEEEGRRDETQSLPGHVTMATQTDKDTATQTDFPRRRTRSDNGSYTEDEVDEVPTTDIAGTGRWIRRYHTTTRRRHVRVREPTLRGAGVVKRGSKRHKIKTPILEETESTLDAAERKDDAPLSYSETKSSMLRRRLVKEKTILGTSSFETVDTPPDSLDGDFDRDDKTRKSVSLKDLRFSDASSAERQQEEEIRRILEAENSISSLRQRSMSDAVYPDEKADGRTGRTEYSSILKKGSNGYGRRNSIGSVGRRQSTSDVPKRRRFGSTLSRNNWSRSTPSLETRSPKKSSRYMEWYKTKRELREREKERERERERAELRFYEDDNKKTSATKRISQSAICNEFQTLEPEYRDKITKGLKSKPPKMVIIKNSDSSSAEKKPGFLSKSRDKIKAFGGKVLGLPSFDDDLDSGIAMSSMLAGNKKRKNQQLLEKKSVFTIAYDDMHTNQLRPDTSSPPF